MKFRQIKHTNDKLVIGWSRCQKFYACAWRNDELPSPGRMTCAFASFCRAYDVLRLMAGAAPGVAGGGCSSMSSLLVSSDVSHVCCNDEWWYRPYPIMIILAQLQVVKKMCQSPPPPPPPTLSYFFRAGASSSSRHFAIPIYSDTLAPPMLTGTRQRTTLWRWWRYIGYIYNTQLL